LKIEDLRLKSKDFAADNLSEISISIIQC